MKIFPRVLSRRSSGFTLIEMIIALSIFSSLMAVLVFGYSQGLNLWQKGRDKTNHWLVQESRRSLLDRLFNQAQPATYLKIDGMHVPHFLGGNEEIEFMTSAPILDFQGRVKPVRLSLREQQVDKYSLVYREGRRYSDPSRGIRWSDNELVIIEDFTDGSFEFEAPAFPLPVDLKSIPLSDADKVRYRDRAEWVGKFSSQIIWRLPRRVIFKFVDSNEEQRSWMFLLPQRSEAWSLEVYSDD